MLHASTCDVSVILSAGEWRSAVDKIIVNNLRYADDVGLITETAKDLQVITDKVHCSSKISGLRINEQNTTVMVVGI